VLVAALDEGAPVLGKRVGGELVAEELQAPLG
jgi:hypothetical protein